MAAAPDGSGGDLLLDDLRAGDGPAGGKVGLGKLEKDLLDGLVALELVLMAIVEKPVLDQAPASLAFLEFLEFLELSRELSRGFPAFLH